MKLIINADDFGYTKGVSEGIIEGYHRGIIKSTTALCNMEDLKYARDLAKDCLDLGIGVHLTLTLGKSLTKNKTLSDQYGYFYRPQQLINHQFDLDEVYLEFEAQIEKYIEVFGHLPTHLDSHHGMHDFKDNLQVTEKLAAKYHLPVRRYGNYQFVSEFIKDNVSVTGLISILEKYRHQDIEIMSHPGYCDLKLYQISSYSFDRVKELAVLCDDRIKQYIKDNNIILTNYQ